MSEASIVYSRAKEAREFLNSDEGKRFVARHTSFGYKEDYVRTLIMDCIFVSWRALSDYEKEFWRTGLAEDFDAVQQKYFPSSR